MLEQRNLGALTVSALGLGCMGMSQSYGPADEDESVRTLHRALDLGVLFLDTADMYGDGHNERLIGRALAERRDDFVLATKFGSPATPPSGGSGRTSSTSTTCTAATRTCPWRRASASCPTPRWGGDRAPRTLRALDELGAPAGERYPEAFTGAVER